MTVHIFFTRVNKFSGIFYDCRSSLSTIVWAEEIVSPFRFHKVPDLASKKGSSSSQHTNSTMRALRDSQWRRKVRMLLRVTSEQVNFMHAIYTYCILRIFQGELYNM